MKSKIEKLIPLLSPRVHLEDLSRLNDGELAPVGDAIIAGKEITYGGKTTPAKACFFNSPASYYKVKQEMRSLNGHAYPAPETVAPAFGTRYYVPAVTASGLRTAHLWRGALSDLRRLVAGFVHLNEESATEHTEAIINAGGGEI